MDSYVDYKLASAGTIRIVQGKPVIVTEPAKPKDADGK